MALIPWHSICQFKNFSKIANVQYTVFLLQNNNNNNNNDRLTAFDPGQPG